MERQGQEASWCLPQEATPTAFGLAAMRNSISTGEDPSLGSSAVPVGWTRAVWTLHFTAIVMPTSHSGEDRRAGFWRRQGQLRGKAESPNPIFPQENRQGAPDLCRPSACHSGSGR